MKRIAFLVCGLVLVLANSAEARWRNRSNNMNGSYNTTYTQPAAAAPVTPNVAAANVAINNPTRPANDNADSSQVANASLTTSDADAKEEKVKTVSYSTSTAQGVANIMASRNQVGHWGGNPGYEGCGCGATAAAAYSICCYGNSGMATVDVGYAQAANGMWYCCRRYR